MSNPDNSPEQGTESDSPEVKYNGPTFRQIQTNTLRLLKNPNPDPIEETTNAEARKKIFESAKPTGLFLALQNDINNIQDRIANEYDQMDFETAIGAVDKLKTDATSIETDFSANKSWSGWNPAYTGMLVEYVEVAKLAMQHSAIIARAEIENNPTQKRNLNDQADKLQRQIDLRKFDEILKKTKLDSLARKEVKDQKAKEQLLTGRAISSQQILPPRRARTPEEEAILGKGDAFSARWLELHEIENDMEPVPFLGINKPFRAADVLSEIMNSGSDSNNALKVVISSCEDPDFQTAMNVALVPLLIINKKLSSSRLDTAAEVAKAIDPQGIATLLVKDQETRRALRLIFQLQGYKIPPEVDEDGVALDDKTPETIPFQIQVKEEDLTEEEKEKYKNSERIIEGDKKYVIIERKIDFKDVVNLTSDQADKYLEAVREAIEVAPGITTDPGVVRLAYTIFRIMGFPHGNKKFAEDLIGKYTLEYPEGVPVVKPEDESEDERRVRVLAYKDIMPFVDDLKIKDPTSGKIQTLRKTLEESKESGVMRFAESLKLLNGDQAEKLARETADLQLILDGMDAWADIILGTGGQGHLKVAERYPAVIGIKELAIARAKRKFTEKTIERIYDPARISTHEPSDKASDIAVAKAYWSQDPILRFFSRFSNRRKK